MPEEVKAYKLSAVSAAGIREPVSPDAAGAEGHACACSGQHETAGGVVVGCSEGCWTPERIARYRLFLGYSHERVEEMKRGRGWR
jgi:hypothetical protein